MSHTVGVDLGGTNVRVAMTDDLGRIVSRSRDKTDKTSGAQGVSQQIARMTRSLKPRIGISCIGIGSAGPLDMKRGSIVRSPNLGFSEVPLVGPLKKEFDVPIYLINDCLAAAISEKEFGQGKGRANLVYVTISSGVGAGIFVDDHLLIGKDGNAHEVGHMAIDPDSELVCGCGKKGHWEAYCGGANIPKFIKHELRSKTSAEIVDSLLFKSTNGNLDRLNSELLLRTAQRGDRLARKMVMAMGRYNAIGFANIVNLYDPELIIVGGAIALAHPKLILEPIRNLMRRYCINRIPRIRLSSLGEDAVLLGASVLSRFLGKDLIEPL